MKDEDDTGVNVADTSGPSLVPDRLRLLDPLYRLFLFLRGEGPLDSLTNAVTRSLVKGSGCWFGGPNSGVAVRGLVSRGPT